MTVKIRNWLMDVEKNDCVVDGRKVAKSLDYTSVGGTVVVVECVGVSLQVMSQKNIEDL